jgi:serine/threonine-protein kinase
MATKCPQCNTDNPEDSKFCKECASSLHPAEDVQASLTKTILTPQHELASGTTFANRYKIIGELGSGGMGVVFKAEDTRLKRTVALKFLPPELTRSNEARERFVQEAQAASGLDHPNICTIHEIDETEEGKVFIAMACYEGDSLKEKITKGLKSNEAVDIAIQVAEGLAKSHNKGIIHRDIKPANIYVTNDGIVKILDFGLAKLSGQVSLTRTGTTMGTVAYMSPEQAQGKEINSQTDIWSLGVVIYEMLTGLLPFKGENEQSMIYSILNEELEEMRDSENDISAEMEKVIDTALAKDLEDRYQQIDDLLDDLKSISQGLEPIKAVARPHKSRISRKKKAIFYAGAVGLIAILAVFLLTVFTGRGSAIDSIAVLPLENRSGDPDQEIFVQGMHEALITELSKISALKVISRPSVMRFKNSEESLPDIAKALNVEGIVAGSAQQEGDRIRISVQLIDVKTEQNLWADNFDKDYRDILILHSEVAQTIAQKISIELTPEEKVILTSAHPVNPDAHRAYSLGRHTRDTEITFEGMRKAIDYFEKALEIDPDYALAYAGLSDAWFELVWSILPRTQIEAREEAKSKAREMAQRALEIDSSLSQAYSTMAQIYYYFDWKWAEAEASFQRALELNPNDSKSHSLYSVFLMGMLRHDEAIEEAKRAEELDPLSPMMSEQVGETLYYARKTDQAIQKFFEVLEQEPDHIYATAMLGWCYWDKGLHKEAQKWWGKMHELTGNTELAQAFAELGAEEAFHKWLEQAKGDASFVWYNNSTLIGVTHAVAGEKEEALEWLEKAYREHDPQMPLLRIWTALDILRDDPRFQDLVRRMNFPE